MIDKVGYNQISDISINTSKKRTQCTQTASEGNAAASLKTSYGDLIQKAQQQQTDDGKAVERARRLLLSGELDSPESIRQAAEKIAEFGV